MTDAGMRLISVEDPAKARNLITAAHIVDDNTQVIDGCAKAAARTKRPQRCSISIEPSDDEPREKRK